MDSKTRFALSVLQLIDDNHKSRRQVAEEVGIKYSTFCDWVNPNHPSSPDIEGVRLIADYFKVRIDSLVDDDITYTADMKFDKMLETKEFINVLGKIPAGVPYEAIENIEPLNYELIPKNYFVGDRKYFGLKLDGDSMAPEYADGDTVIFLKSSTCESGSNCCIRIGNTDATFKKVVIKEDGIKVIPLNPNNASKFKERFYTRDQIENLPVEILGIAIYKIPSKSI